GKVSLAAGAGRRPHEHRSRTNPPCAGWRKTAHRTLPQRSGRARYEALAAGGDDGTVSRNSLTPAHPRRVRTAGEASHCPRVHPFAKGAASVLGASLIGVR